MMQEIGTGQSGRVFYIIAKTVKPEGKVDAMNEKEKVCQNCYDTIYYEIE